MELVLPKPFNNPQLVTLNRSFNFPKSLHKPRSPAASSSDPNAIENQPLPMMQDIMAASKSQNLHLELHKLGPFFQITAKNSTTGAQLGRAEGMIRLWSQGMILHLDSIKLQRETLTMKRSIFGIGLLIGAVAIRHGFDCGCRKAELLAINDSDVYHSKLVRFYRRLGFKQVHEVTGSSIGDLGHMLVWGGVGTRMDADVEHLLVKWSSKFNPPGPDTDRYRPGTQVDGLVRSFNRTVV